MQLKLVINSGTVSWDCVDWMGLTYIKEQRIFELPIRMHDKGSVRHEVISLGTCSTTTNLSSFKLQENHFRYICLYIYI